jgi:P27 family predicted phage terminase small subunit
MTTAMPPTISPIAPRASQFMCVFRRSTDRASATPKSADHQRWDCSAPPPDSTTAKSTLERRTNATGPAPKPSTLKKLHGTFRLDRAPEFEAIPNLASRDQLKAPDWLSERATEKWNELALRLHNQGLLTELDLDTLSLYCTAWSNWRDAEEALLTEGPTTEAQSGYKAVSPHVTRSKNHVSELVKLGSLLGLSPSARIRIEVSTPPGLTRIGHCRKPS